MDFKKIFLEKLFKLEKKRYEKEIRLLEAELFNLEDAFIRLSKGELDEDDLFRQKLNITSRRLLKQKNKENTNCKCHIIYKTQKDERVEK